MGFLLLFIAAVAATWGMYVVFAAGSALSRREQLIALSVLALRAAILGYFAWGVIAAKPRSRNWLWPIGASWLFGFIRPDGWMVLIIALGAVVASRREYAAGQAPARPANG